MKHIRAIKDFVCTKVHGSLRNIDITCDEYATVWKFTANVRGREFPAAIEWSYKKKEYKSYEIAKQHFLSELYTKAW